MFLCFTAQESYSKTEFRVCYEDLGPLSYFLGISFTRTKDHMFLCQQKYAQNILARANMSSCKPASTPVDTKSKLSVNYGKLVDDPTFCRQIAGALQYLTITRPDIAYAVQQLCLFMHDPREPYFQGMKRVLRYVQGTLSFVLHFTSTPASSLVSYSDADSGGCLDTRRSTSGYFVFLGYNLIS